MARDPNEARKLETAVTYYGINPKTFEVESVVVTHGGKMRKTGSDREMNIDPRKKVRTEVIVIYGLMDMIEVYPSARDFDFTKEQIEQLKRKAADYKAKAGA